MGDFGFVFNSSAMGPVRVVPDGEGADCETPYELESAMTFAASNGQKIERVALKPQAFNKLAACLGDMARYSTEAMMRSVGDNDLIAELQRRYPNRAAMLQQLTDDELRAEMERRELGYRVDEFDTLEAERDHWKTVAEALSVNQRDAQRERDEWRRRAEHAEKALFQMQEAAKSLTARAEAAEAIVAERSRLTPEQRENIHRGLLPCGTRPTRFTQERGPGIAAKPAPADAHYVDPWDFLADE